MPLPSIAVFILSVGCALMIFLGIGNLLAMKYADHPAAAAWSDLYGNS